MAIRKSSNPFKAIFVAVALVLGMVALVMFYQAVQTNTEQRSKAAIDDSIYKSWEFEVNSGSSFDGWIGNQVTSLNIRGGSLWAIVNDTPSTQIRPIIGSISNSAFSVTIPAGNKGLRMRMAVGAATPTNPNDQVKCQPRPACLDTKPSCDIAEPVEGWCKASPNTSSGQFQFAVYYSTDGLRPPTRVTFSGIADGAFHDYYLRFPDVGQISVNKLQFDFNNFGVANKQVQLDYIRIVGPVTVTPEPTVIVSPMPTTMITPVPQGNWPQRARQLFLNNEGTKFYYRTCDWNYSQGTAVNCAPANTWLEYPVADIVDPRTLSPGVPKIRDYNTFVFDAVENGRTIQKIRQSYINDLGTIAYYRTCIWNPALALPEKCQPENTPWTALPLNQLQGASPTPIYRKFTSFVYDRGNNLPQGIRQILLDNTGTTLYYRTCEWDTNRATPVNCGPSDRWNMLSVRDAIGTPSSTVSSIREYSAFIYDVYSSTGVKSQNIRQLFFNEQGNTVYYRTCRWNPTRAGAENCMPVSGWINTSIVNITGQGNSAYLGYNVFTYDRVNPPNQ